METGDIVRINLQGVCRSKPMLNVFWYICQTLIDPPETEEVYEDLFDQFMVNVVTPLSICISSSSRFTGVDMENFTHSSEISERDISVLGGRGADQTMDYAAWSFTLNRTNKTTRKGGKRIGGIASEDLSYGFPVAPMLTILGAAATGIGEILPLPDGVTPYGTFRPIIMGRVKYTNPTTGKTYYVPDITRFQPVTSVTWAHVGHQESRQGY